MPSAADIVERWRKYLPPQVPKDDVAKVLAAYFPGSQKHAGGSHEFCVSDPDLYNAEQEGRNTGTTGGRLSIPVTRGRYVKRAYIDDLLDAIDQKTEIRRRRDENQTGPSGGTP
jgi:hypothetical protein